MGPVRVIANPADMNIVIHVSADVGTPIENHDLPSVIGEYTGYCRTRQATAHNEIVNFQGHYRKIGDCRATYVIFLNDLCCQAGIAGKNRGGSFRREAQIPTSLDERGLAAMTLPPI